MTDFGMMNGEAAGKAPAVKSIYSAFKEYFKLGIDLAPVFRRFITETDEQILYPSKRKTVRYSYDYCRNLG
jgi:hypothetical protein